MSGAISGSLPNGIKFIGADGWIFVTRGGAVTPSDPTGPQIDPLVASNPVILTSEIGPGGICLARTPEQHRNWLDSIKSRAAPWAPAEIGHRVCSTCLLHSIAMHTRRRLRWDPAAERFIGGDEANAILSRPQRSGYTV